MTLETLIAALRAVTPVRAAGAVAASAPVTGITYDSRQVKPGMVFVAVEGRRVDGARFIPEAVANGAVAVVAEIDPPADSAVTWFVVPDARLALAWLAATFFKQPSIRMTVVGVTGTNGKTTTTYLLAEMFERAGVRCGRIGTVSHRLGMEERDATRTTPEAPDVQRLLHEMAEAGCRACAMEVSSHALALRRVDGTRFAAAIFTNLTRDHLDFHGDMERYFQAKRRLFELLPPDAPAVVNLDDPRGAILAATVARPVTFAIDRAADVMPGPMAASLDGLEFDIRTPGGTVHARSGLLGRPNAANLLAATAAAVALDVPLRAIEAGIAGLSGVPGRFQVVSDRTDDLTVVIDYAHTDDALKNLLETARPLAARRLITVFGCGGDRDPTKRPLMGAVAARLSDLVILTSDNPRSEDPERIIQDIQRGIGSSDRPAGIRGSQAAAAQGPRCLVVVDRADAIERAVREAESGDLVLIAGKGHEKYQAIGNRMLPFDDGAVAAEALARRRARLRAS